MSDQRPVALITGATRGIGREVAAQLATGGYAVLIAARNVEAAVETAASLRAHGDVTGLPVALDVSEPASVAAAADVIRANPGRLDVLVNNAAAYVDWSEFASSADLDRAAAVIDTNLFGAWRMVQATLPLLRVSPHPRIVNVSSGAGSHGDHAFGLGRRHGAAASYGISKAALNALTQTLAAELADTSILVNAVCPGLTATFPGAEAMGARPINVSAATVVWAATLPDDGPNGGFFRDRARLPW